MQCIYRAKGPRTSRRLGPMMRRDMCRQRHTVASALLRNRVRTGGVHSRNRSSLRRTSAMARPRCRQWVERVHMVLDQVDEIVLPLVEV